MAQQDKNYRDRVSDVKAASSRHLELLEELLEQLEVTKRSARQSELDLETEQHARRRLQQEVEELKQERRRDETHNFIAVLLDADADNYIFRHDLLADGAQGGQTAADELAEKVRMFMKQDLHLENSQSVKVTVSAFANVGGLGKALVQQGKLRDANQLRDFVAGFNMRQGLFNFADVCSVKESADNKIRETLQLLVYNRQCVHILLGCCHDAGYAPFLGQFVGDGDLRSRITFLGGPDMPAAMKKLELPVVTFGKLFAVSGYGPGDGAPKGPSRMASARPLPLPGNKFKFPEFQQAKRLEDVQWGVFGRIDKWLKLSEGLKKWAQGSGLCPALYLKGECLSGDCKRSHKHKALTDDQFDALWFFIRGTVCKARMKDGKCEDKRCIYGHRDG
ncbi:hypothetical protein B0I35DRAFT_434294 [Stachybotrys elegans]|uniref:DUF7923 domain-containing protein n=1 Tax=Stachybotrys elegans TaxID=80388 RepID=A0A8K0WQL6_9HYPO|nr:hypothetical protein B0I35DRAFT_434294 [Stachybotrys elegans]